MTQPSLSSGRLGRVGQVVPRLGFVASAFTTTCCLGLSVALSFASGIGAVFLTRDSTLQPLLIIALAITVAGSAITFQCHRSPAPLILTVVAGALVWASLYGPLSGGIGVEGALAGHGGGGGDAMGAATGSGGVPATALVWIGLAVLLSAQLWDVVRLRRCRASRMDERLA